MKRKLFLITHPTGAKLYVVADDYAQVGKNYAASKCIELIGEVLELRSENDKGTL